VTATANSGYTFANWTESGSVVNSAASYTFTLSASRNLVAAFTAQYLLTTSAGTGGTVSPPSGYYNSGQSVSVAASADAGYSFSGWTGSGTGSYSGTANPATVTMNAPITETASFTQSFTDDPLIVGSTRAEAIHVTELRAAIDTLRARHGLATFFWTDPDLVPRQTRVQAIHIVDLRTALGGVYQAVGRSGPSYTDPTIVSRHTAIRASHISELRAAVRALP
jgi:hypothetical protein